MITGAEVGECESGIGCMLTNSVLPRPPLQDNTYTAELTGQPTRERTRLHRTICTTRSPLGSGRPQSRPLPSLRLPYLSLSFPNILAPPAQNRMGLKSRQPRLRQAGPDRSGTAMISEPMKRTSAAAPHLSVPRRSPPAEKKTECR